MKNTEITIQNKFIKLLDRYKIDEIDVNMICKSLGIKRQTFYYHYKNIYDLIYSIFYKKRLEASNPLKFELIVSDAIDFIFSDEVFYREVAASNARDILSGFITSFLFKSFFMYLDQYKLDSIKRKDIAHYMADSISQEIIYYYAEEPDMNAQEIKIRMLCLIDPAIISRIIEKYNENVKV
jgi:AcrR family transcriptional regulator